MSCRSPRAAIRSARAYGSSACATTRTPRRAVPDRPASPPSPPFLQGTVSSFQVVPNPTALGWRSWYGAWYFQDAIQLRRNFTLQLGVRHEFSNGWNEVAGRAANFVTGPDGVLETSVRLGDSVFTENNAKRLFAPRVSPGVGSVRQGQDQPARGLRHPLHDDRRVELPAQFPAPLQRQRRLLQPVAVLLHAHRFPARPCRHPAVPACPPPAPPTRRRAYRPTPRRRPCRNGTSPSSSNSAAVPPCASPTPDPSGSTDCSAWTPTRCRRRSAPTPRAARRGGIGAARG